MAKLVWSGPPQTSADLGHDLIPGEYDYPDAMTEKLKALGLTEPAAKSRKAAASKEE
jgi:hypothetical protein